MQFLRRLSLSSHLTFAGLAIGILGLVIQWIAEPAKFAAAQDSFGVAFPPGIAFIAAAGLLTLAATRWWWHPVFGVLIAFWIVVGGTLANQLLPNFSSPNPGTVAGNIVMAAGLILAGVAGIGAMISGFRTRPAPRHT